MFIILFHLNSVSYSYSKPTAENEMYTHAELFEIPLIGTRVSFMLINYVDVMALEAELCILSS